MKHLLAVFLAISTALLVLLVGLWGIGVILFGIARSLLR